jgi:hypothetical protein
VLTIIIALEKWNLGPSSLHPHNPDLIYTRVSGYGQTGPWASRPGYASVCEAESGFRYINGFPDPETGLLAGPPVRPNISLGDSVAGLHAAFGTVSVPMISITLPSDVVYVGCFFFPRCLRYWLAGKNLIKVMLEARLSMSV